MKKIKRLHLLVFVVPFLFLLFGIITLKDYGINWDEPYHFAKGNAVLHYVLTGKRDFLDIPAYSPKPKGDSDFMDQFGVESRIYVAAEKSKEIPESKIRRSYFQSDLWTFDYLTSKELSGHPQINDILAALSNYVLYQKLEIVGDIESYHLFEVFMAFLIVAGVGLLTYSRLGLLASIFASTSLASYPLFFSESHFNIKDPVLTSFFGLTIIFFYLGITKRSWKKIIFSSIFFGLAIGTKFNALFVAPILVIWLILHFIFIGKKERIAQFKAFKKDKRLSMSIFAYPFLSLFTFYALSPIFWLDPINRLSVMITYYRQMGIGIPAELSNYILNGVNTFPVFWFFTTTQIPYLILFAVGLLVSIYLVVKKKDSFFALILLWLFVPFFRVTVGNTNIYGGIRQIMEFLPAMAILIGVGADFIVNRFQRSKVVVLVLFVALSMSIYEMAKIHPNENVYFNQLVGGLSGAKEKNVPYWGNSFGNVYLQGVNWLNENAPENSKLALPINTPHFIPRVKLREDIAFSNAYLSGDKHLGEYVMEHYFDWYPASWYRYAYYNTFLNPVHEVKVDGVPILIIWKNSPEYIKPGFETERSYRPQLVRVEAEEVAEGVTHKKLMIDLGKEINLTQLKVEHSQLDCKQQPSGRGYVALSNDFVDWRKEPEEIYFPQVAMEENDFDEDTFTFFFAAKKARYIMVDSQIDNPCLAKNPLVFVRGLAL